MTGFQKLIKYCAMAFAAFLAINIIGGIVGAVAFFGGLFTGDGVLNEMKGQSFAEEFTELKVDINAADFTVKSGESFAVETNLEYLTVEEKDGCLVIEETEKFKFNYSDAALVLYIPEGFVFDKAELVTGAGRLTVDTLSAKDLKLELGAGQVKINELNASSKAEIDGGAGEVRINGGTLYNLELNMGVGELNLTSAVLGNSALDYGVGEANLVLVGIKDDYCITLDKGLGNAKFDGENMTNGSIYGDGVNRIDIDGGVGAVNVDFTEN